MKHFLLFVFMTITLCPCSAGGKQDTLTWKRFVNEHPKCMKNDIVYEGCNLLLCSDGEYLFAQFNILHPAMQMRILMQGLTLYIDPTGKKKEKYSIIFPSASDVRDVMSVQTPSVNGIREERPDITPLLQSLQAYGALYDVKGRTSTIDKNLYSIMLNEDKKALSYSVIIPIDDMLKERKLSQTWSIGIYSEGGRRDNDGPGIERQPMGMRPENRKSMGDNQETMRKIMSKDIESWVKFSFEKICSLND